MEDKREETVRFSAPRMHSFEMQREEEIKHGGTVIRKTKSLNPQFLINIDEIINNATAGSYHNISSNVNSSNGRKRYSFSLSDQLSDVLRLPAPKCSKKEFFFF